MTDTQHSIGKLITNDELKRDSIHIAVIPVTAASTLKPNADVGVVEETEDYIYVSDTVERKIGKVDPYLKHDVHKESRFFLFMYPNTIEGLNHTWKHWAFDVGPREKKRAKDFLVSWLEMYLTDYNNDANFLETKYNKMLEQFKAERDIDFEGSFGNWDEDTSSITSEFWRSLEIVTGKEATQAQKEQYFGCCC